MRGWATVLGTLASNPVVEGGALIVVSRVEVFVMSTTGTGVGVTHVVTLGVDGR